MKKIFNDNFIDEDDIIVTNIMENEYRSSIINKINNMVPLSIAELDYLKVCRDLYIPKNRNELLSIMTLFFTQNITSLNCINVSNINDMSDLFYTMEKHFPTYVDEIKIEIDEWDVSNVKDMHAMFSLCHKFVFDVSKWDVSNVYNMSSMFYGCYNFNSDLSRWNVSNVMDMHAMFGRCHSFNSDLSKWDVSNVDNMNYMFYQCNNFNSDLSNWNVSIVTDMSHMFSSCFKFNSDIGNWDVYSVKNMTGMFYRCFMFNSNLNNWDISNAKCNINLMFAECNIRQEYMPHLEIENILGLFNK